MVLHRSTEEIGWLKEIKPPVKDIYWEGQWQEGLFEKCVAVVGSRRMTTYGARVLEKLIPQLVMQGWTIVSGFMYGIDKTAHKLTVECGGRTIAVLGWGIDAVGDGDEDLRAKIVKSGGLVISQWKDQKPARWTFPMRNKIVAQVCQELVVVEAAGKSGALITVDMAAKLGRKIWAVPGPVTSSVSEGTNKLIAEGKAQIWLFESQIPSLKTQIPMKSQESKSSNITKLLENNSLDAGEIARALGKPIEEVGAELTMLVLSGQVIEREGKYFRD